MKTGADIVEGLEERVILLEFTFAFASNLKLKICSCEAGKKVLKKQLGKCTAFTE